MKYKFLFIYLFVPAMLLAQEAVHNYGTIQVHGDTYVGFHMDLVNDGSFDQNTGVVGFYSDDAP
ncbi:hypothetical protein [Muriicola soli]|uniref:hypothetical protein n=1 Tax=Muriicola soli TaxID=2507538 RepID=UPI001FE9646C|nr:hypothetical protein [Muriicola soli]